ncbi:similar to Saccharomyces cerevisiae YIL014W MNT3 Alpha-1,3-mannosyltransferase [Maudiozyma saulgeensis]|uniref:Similar to Saccharomyces cerevisiae YIL014W MNT3 Alpha-1,3-mannosyltransferase n=1 Tax=Maudiozyma saulgeensis TaxID=1789683 RepID=A0A1X7R8Q2_9SACH|nr:similar to Saccharomyces cerevisiae YIL014W MNT3 Alpha-1,3-mannosyltransferase [Kazachstania saulgeensis]
MISMRMKIRVHLHKRKQFLVVVTLSVILIILCLFTFKSLPTGVKSELKQSQKNVFEFGAFKNGYYVDPDSITLTDEPEFDLEKTDTKYSLFNDSIFAQLKDLDTVEKCNKLARSLILNSRSDVFDIAGSMESLIRNVERFRIYDHCFLRGNVELKDIFVDDLNLMTQLTHTLFPFLNIQFTNEYQFNEILISDLTTNEEKTVVFHKHMGNPFEHWIKTAKGKGIVTTMSIKEIDYFLRLTKVLDKLGNKLPIQIVVSNLNDFYIIKNTLKKKLINSNQNVMVLNVSQLLDTEFTKLKVKGYINKWIATLFNTFEEFIFMDVDVVPFQQINKFFKTSEYKNHGFYMYRDRDIGHAKLEPHCRANYFNLEPTPQEHQLIGTQWAFNLKSSSSQSSKVKSTQHEVYHSFFNNLIMHQVDSGLVLIRKTVENYSSLLMAMQLNMADSLEDCVHGDKEYFWLGPLIAGHTYSVDPTRCGAVGSLYEEEEQVNDGENIKRVGVCSTQIGHCNNKNSLLWLNGGAKLCKNPEAATNDFKNYPEFMSERYGNVDELSKIYNSGLNIDGMVIPDSKKDTMTWMQTRECSQYRFCAYVDISKKTHPSKSGNLIRFDHKQIKTYNEISAIWSEDIGE